jgi:hypothetical protein
MSENVGASTSRNPKALHGLNGDKFTFLTIPAPLPTFSFTIHLMQGESSFITHISDHVGLHGGEPLKLYFYERHK